MLPLDPPQAILAGLLGAFLFYAFLMKYTTGTLWPRGRVDCNTWWRWSWSLITAFMAFTTIALYLAPSRLDFEPCRSTPDPWGAWRIVYDIIAVAFIAFAVIALLAKNRGC